MVNSFIQQSNRTILGHVKSYHCLYLHYEEEKFGCNFFKLLVADKLKTTRLILDTILPMENYIIFKYY